ncbi:UvrD-helicase domain-containing protein [Leifsonia sp. 1010]|uniref:HelD family protein n=1 Tax=Leifsonia sp. 1010 TaxID=2817769 RepID=UPI00286228DA|nr:UvrD-helicase domain-containing protein [Leifsonia sp. 1010]MDR6613348.1 DNA polymerase III delta prime subunit [Leifsonia sp. 1010]
MTLALPSLFALDAHPAKAAPELIDDDARHFARIEARLAAERAEVDGRLAVLLATPGGNGQEAYEREVEIVRLNRRARLLRRFGADLCIGRVVADTGTIYIGRVGLADSDGERLLVDWRTPAAEPFFGATLAHPMGLTSRRRYRWTDRRVTDYWDETFTETAASSPAALDDQSAFIASLGASRTPRMRDVLGTIQADQDAIIRADGQGTLVVDGGPGTGKTVVALHRAAYLLYSDPRLQSGHGGVLFVGPSHAYTDYVADILPGLGEEGVRTCTLTDLVPEGAEAVPEADRRVALLKGDGRMPEAVEAAISLSERPPSRPTVLYTPWGELRVGPREWAEALAAADPTAPHNDARAEIWEALLDILVDLVSTRNGESDAGSHGRWSAEGWGDAGLDDAGWDDAGWDDAASSRDDDAPRWGFDDEEEFDAYGLAGGRTDADAIRRTLTDGTDLPAMVDAVWPLLDPAAIVRRLWSSPALLLRCAPWLTTDEAALLQRSPSDPWTLSDLPLLDAALQRAGDPERDRRRRAEAARAAADRAVMDDVIHDLIATDDSDLKTMSMLRGQDLRAALDTYTGPAASSTELLAGPFAHIIVDEAQELTPAEWAMVTRRVPSHSLTVVGDRAQARHGFRESWTERLAGVGLPDATVATLSVNYRTPVAVMEQAAPVIRAVLPDANVPTSIRDNGIPVRHARASDRDRILRAWLGVHAEGTACVIGDDSFAGMPRVRSLSAVEAKGLEFDLVLLAEPGARPGGALLDRPAVIESAVDRYVAMTRTTGELVILDASDY